MFMKYYSWFTEILQSVLNLYMLSDAEIITEDDRDFIIRYGDMSNFNIIVMKTINHLLSGDTNFFYKLLEAIQYRILNGDKITFRIQIELNLGSQKTSIGTYACTYIQM